jgi:hypothetical protein
MTLNAELSTGRAALGEGSRDAVATTSDYRIPKFERLLWTLVESGGIAERHRGTQRRSGGRHGNETCRHDNGRQGRPLR